MIAEANPDGTQILTNVFLALGLVFGAFAVMLWYPPLWGLATAWRLRKEGPPFVA